MMIVLLAQHQSQFPNNKNEILMKIVHSFKIALWSSNSLVTRLATISTDLS